MHLLILQDRVLGLGVYNLNAAVGRNHSLWVNFTSGCGYTCTWMFGNGKTLVTSQADLDLSDGGHITTVYQNEDTYLFEATCKNGATESYVYSTVTVIHPIIGLVLETKGAIYQTEFHIRWTILHGTDSQWLLTLGGIQLDINFDEAGKSGQTAIPQAGMLTGIYLLILHGWNVISDEVLTANFTIDVYIKNITVSPTPGTKLDILTVDCLLEFKVDMLEGTTVSVSLDVKDGTSIVEYETGLLVQWSVPFVRTHCFQIPGEYKVEIIIKNNFREYRFYVLVVVYNIVSNLTLSVGPAPWFKHHGRAPFYFTTTNLYPPTRASIDFDYDDGNSEVLPFVLGMFYFHDYPSKGPFNIITNVSNKVSWEIYSTSVQMYAAVVNLYVEVKPGNVIVVGRPITVTVFVDSGDEIVYHFIFTEVTTTTFTKKREGEQICYKYVMLIDI